MFNPRTARAAFRHTGAGLLGAGLAVALVWSANLQAEPPGDGQDDAPPPAQVVVFGKVVDDQTGKPVMGFITQAGKFDPKDPGKVTWGFSESRTSSSSFSATVRWNEGWTARILADGYVPQPVIDKAPPAGKARIEKVIRLKKGRVVHGRVLDHLEKPVKDASVFAIRPVQMTLAQGQAVRAFDGEPDPSVHAVKTDAEGRFKLALSIPAGPARPKDGDRPPPAKAPGLAISSPALDAWPVPLPEGDDEAVIHLPAPTRVEIEYDIEGGEEEAQVFLQSVMHEVEEWKGIEIIRHLPIKNQGQIEITSLPPGRYQFARSRSLRYGNIGQGLFLDRQFVEVTSDEPTSVSFVRKTGARLTGSVEWDEGTKLAGVIISVRKVIPADAAPGERLFPPAFDARLLRVAVGEASGEKPEIVGNRGLFLTERIPPGTYEISADGYTPLTPEQQRRTGITLPALTASTIVTVPESGKVPSLKLKLEKH